jgi:hypothetical protein
MGSKTVEVLNNTRDNCTNTLKPVSVMNFINGVTSGSTEGQIMAPIDFVNKEGIINHCALIQVNKSIEMLLKYCKNFSERCLPAMTMRDLMNCLKP